MGPASDLCAGADVQSGLLGDLADRGGGWRLAWFDLAAGERPEWDAVAAAHHDNAVGVW